MCSAFQIGPPMELSIPFDLIWYNNGVQFHMECLEPAQAALSNPEPAIDINALEYDLRECLHNMHKLHLVHRDIKPDNVLYNRRLKKFVLCDFGIAKFVLETEGQKSAT